VAADLQDGLRRAAQARIALEHPNLLPARAERDGNGHIALRLRPYSAPTLTQVISSGPSSPRDALRILRGVALAVEALGRAGLVARDLNPDHILVCPRRGGILADLAISPELLPRAPGGDDRNYAYRSPEERALLPIDIRSNVYSLGAVFLATQTTRNGKRTALPAATHAVVKRAMSTEPERRSFTPGEFIEALASATGLLPKRSPARGRPAVDRSTASPSGNGWRAPPPREPSPKAPATPAPAAVEAGTRPTTASTRRKPSRSRARLPAFGAAVLAAKARLPRPTMPRLSAPRLPRPHVRAMARLRPPSLPRLHLPTLPRPRLPALPRFHAPARVPLAAVPFGLAVVGCLLVGVLLLGRATDDGAQRSELEGPSFTMRLPADWGETEVARAAGINLPAPVAAAPLGEDGAGLVVGRVPDMLALDERFRSEGERTEIRLGRLEAWRYSGLRPSQELRATVYLAPTTGAPLLAICHAPRQTARLRLPQCERIASTIDLRDERPASLARVTRHQERLDMVIASLRRTHQAGRRQLAKVALAADQARVAGEIQRAYREAAERVARAEPPNGAAALDDLVRSLRATAMAYGRLADAAGEADKAAYRAASKAVLRGEEAVDRETMAAV
jgi:hypothetical protein